MAVPRLFIDASVFIAATASPTGGSAAVLELGRRGHVRLLASKQVLLEAEHNIRRKMPSDVLLRFYQYVGTLPLRIVTPATAEELAQAAEVVAEKDAHVLAAALKANVDALLTLDRKHLLAPAVRAASAFAIQTPGEFLQGVAT
jgi:predicted nucleic acid-binding protein